MLAGRTPAEIAPELNISLRTFDRTLAGGRLAREWELRRLSELLELPPWFLTQGLLEAPAEVASVSWAEVAERLDAIDRRLDVSDPTERLAGLEETLREIARLCRGIEELVDRAR